MIKKIALMLWLPCSFFLGSAAQATNLFVVYNQALVSDPTYQQAIAQRLSDKEGVPISLASLLPGLTLLEQPQLNRTQYSGAYLTNELQPSNQTNRQNNLSLTATQTVFDFGKYSAFQGARALSKKADATLNTATQDLMTRVATAYFAILQDEDYIIYAASAKEFYAEQYDQIDQQYKVGLKTVTDVYTARASYEGAVATYITAQTLLANDKENLRAITGRYYEHLDKLSEHFPLITPYPQNINTWEDISLEQNWAIKAAQYAVDSARQKIRQQFAGNLPTVNAQGVYQTNYSLNLAQSPTVGGIELSPSGPSRSINRQVLVNVNLPILAGGGVLAQTSQAQYDYDVAMQILERTVRQTINITRQSYLNVQAGISKIKADRQAIRSYESSLEGMAESYKVGTATLVDVLNQQQKLLESQRIYTVDRYGYVNNILSLKKSAGTLGFDDFIAINRWLLPMKESPVKAKKYVKKKEHVKKKKHKKQENTTLKKQSTTTSSKKVKTKIFAQDKKKKTLHIAQHKPLHSKKIVVTASNHKTKKVIA